MHEAVVAHRETGRMVLDLRDGDVFSCTADPGCEFGEGMTIDDYVRAIGLPSGGAIRASLGIASNLADVDRFISFAHEFVDLPDVPHDLPPRIAC